MRIERREGLDRINRNRDLQMVLTTEFPKLAVFVDNPGLICPNRLTGRAKGKAGCSHMPSKSPWRAGQLACGDLQHPVGSLGISNFLKAYMERQCRGVNRGIPSLLLGKRTIAC